MYAPRPEGFVRESTRGLDLNFTGVSDAYETPTDAEITIDTSHISPQEAVQRIVWYLARRNLWTEKSPVTVCAVTNK